MAKLAISPSGWRVPVWYWLIVLGMFVVIQSVLQTMGSGVIAYSEFKSLIHAGKVDSATVSDDIVTGTLKPGSLEGFLPKSTLDQLHCSRDAGCAFTTFRVADSQLAQDLEKGNVRFVGQPKSLLASVLSWVAPVLLFFLLWSWMARRSGAAAGGLFSFGKSGARVYAADKSSVRFADVAGIDEARDELMEVVEFLKSPERYRRLGARIPKGVLIVGPPGTGKTLLAKAVAGEAGVPFFTISGSEFVEMFVGVGAARVRDLFAQAQEKAPCIIFIDELDALGRARGVGGFVSGYNEQEQTLNQLLVEMDGFESNAGVIILAATNRPEILDPALLRPGRFDRHIALDRPDLKGREEILRLHARQVVLAPEVSLSDIAARTAGFAGADLANVVNEAALLAGRRGKAQVDPSDIDEAIDRIVAGLEKKTRVMSRKEKEAVAWHEAGHALIAEFREHADPVSKISIIPRGIAALGYTQQTPTEDRYLLKKSELLDRIDVFLGGHVAEEVVFGDVSTGVRNDLSLATDLARRMVTEYGMSARLGAAAFEEARTSPFPSMQPRGAHISEATARSIDAEVIEILDAAHRRVKQTLITKRELLDALAAALLERETVDRATLDQLLRAHGASQRPEEPAVAERHARMHGAAG